MPSLPGSASVSSSPHQVGGGEEASAEEGDQDLYWFQQGAARLVGYIFGLIHVFRHGTVIDVAPNYL